MTGAVVEDAWTCPRCLTTWTRLDQTLPQWQAAVRRIQAAHSPQCTRKAKK